MAGSPPLDFLYAPSVCIFCLLGSGVVSWFAYASPGLLALHGLGILPISFFLRPLLLRFSLSRFLSLAVPLWWCLWGCSSTVALLPWAGVAISRSLGCPSSQDSWFEFLELCSSSRSLPVVTGSRSFLACWGLPVPLRLGVCLLHLLIPCGFPLWGFAFVLDFGVPLVWLCLCLLWVRLHVPFLSVTLSGSVVGLFHLSACVRWFVYLVCFLAVLFFCAVPGYVT